MGTYGYAAPEDSILEDLSCVDVEKLDKSIDISVEKQCSSTPGVLPKDITASKSISSNSESKDCMDIEAPPANDLDSFEQCSRDNGMLEEFILKDLEMIKHGTTACNDDQDEDLNIKKAIPHTDHIETMRRSEEEQPMESATNNIDRIIANIMFKSMEFNIHDPPSASSINCIQQVIGINDQHGNSSKALNMGEKSCYSHPHKLLADAVIPRLGLSSQPKDTGSYIACEDPPK